MKIRTDSFAAGWRSSAIALVVLCLSMPAAGWVQTSQLTAQVDATAFENFGDAVAISGNDVIVGAPKNLAGHTGIGAAYIYHYQAGAWSLQAQLVAADGASGDNFGIAVGISGDWAVVGARNDNDGGISSGSAYVYHRISGTWSPYGPKLLATDRANGDLFGGSVGIDGDIIVIGAEKGSGPGGSPIDSGAAYIYRLVSGTWTQQAKLNAGDLDNDDLFGQRVAISGTSVLIGAPSDDNLSGSDAGSAYVFVNSGGPTWSQQGKLTAGVSSLGSLFGRAVSINGDTAVAGAPLANIDGMSYSGAAYVFTRTAGVWSPYAGNPLIGDTTFDEDEFGISIAVNGSSIVAGSIADIFYGVDPDFFVAEEAGVGYVFNLQAGIWTQTGTVQASDFASGDQYSMALALGSGGTLVVGSHGSDLEAQEAGAAYIFDLGTGVADTDEDGLPDSLEIAMAGVGSCPSPTNADTDGDGLSDGYENANGPNICNPDVDVDGLTDGAELLTHSTDPNDSDSDNDGLSDGGEVLIHFTDPKDADSDNDGLDDGVEIAFGSNPLEPDGDDDGLSDVLEMAYGTLPMDSDTDNDGLLDGPEVALISTYPCLNPLVADSDGDGLNDGAEITAMLLPCDADTDNDGLSDGNETTHSTNPAVADSDADGMLDGAEVAMAGSFGGCPNPLDSDSDNDTILDGDEVMAGLGPCDHDTDHDGLNDEFEDDHNTNPLDPDSDDDGLLDGTELDMAMGGGCPNPLSADSDGDTLSDGYEVAHTTNVCSADTDGDGFSDNIDPTPTVPGVPPSFLATFTSALAANVNSLNVSLFLGPNNNARAGRQNEMATLLNNATKELNKGKIVPALAYLQTLENRIDDISPQPDWMSASPQKSQLHQDLVAIITLLQMMQ